MKGEEVDAVPKSSKVLLITGLLFVSVSILMFVFIAGAETEARRIGKVQENSDEAYPGVGSIASKSGNIKLDSGNFTIARTDPPGAVVSPKDSLHETSPRLTPTLVKPVPGLSFETPFRRSQVTGTLPERQLKLSLKPFYLILVNLLWPGLLMLLIALKQIRNQRGEIAEALSPSPSRPSSSESGSITRVVEPPQPRQVSQIFSLVEGPYQHDPATPEQLIYGRFVQGEIIGKGGMGTVYRCQSCVPGDKGLYALKVLLPEWSKSPDFRARFEREADICHKLTHRNLVRAHERGEKDGDLWMVMDFVQGSELNQWLQKQKRSPEEIVALFVQICDGLSHAHKQDIVHRDLKPENILVTEDGRKAVIADFGLAKGKHYATITKTNTTLGTPIYMPPEQITGGSGGPLGDLYSLGCILYESLSGSIPFPGDDVLALLNSKLTGKSPPALTPEQATPELRGIVEKLMAYKPEDRFQSAEELKESLNLLSRESNSSGS